MNPTTLDTGEQLDPAVIKVVKTIRTLEGGNYDDRTGDSGSSAGAFQWNNNKKKLAPNELPARWKEHAQEILGDGNAPMTKENQNKVIYGKVKKWKDDGLQPEEIDAKWNGATLDPNTNRYVHVSADRAKKFRETIMKESQGYKTQPKFSEKVEEKPQPEQTNLYNKVMTPVENFGAGVASSLGKMGLGLYEGAGRLVGANDFADKVAGIKEKAFVNPDLPENQSLDTKSAKAGKITGDIVPYLAAPEKIIPQVIKDTAVAFGQTGGDVKKAGIAGLISGGLGLAGKAYGAVKGARSVLEDIMPDITQKTFKGATKKGLFGKISPIIDEKTKDIAKTVESVVPEFKSLGTFTEKVGAVRKALVDEAEKLKSAVINSGQNRVFTFKELAKKMDNVEKGIQIKADPVIERQFNLAKEAALRVARQKGGTIDSLFDARKAFDDIVERDFPTLYDRTNAPMRNAITSMRNVMNDFIESNLPKAVGFKNSLLKQRHLFEALDNLNPKAFEELGTTGFSRFAQKNPTTTGLLKGTGKALLQGLGMGGLMAGYNKFKD